MSTQYGALDRQIQEFQFRIQQRLTLYDQEISRLAETLTTLKTKIVESQRTSIKIDEKIQQTIESKESNRKKRQIMRQSLMAQLEAKNNQAKQQLQDQQSKEVEELQKEFELKLEQISSQAGQKSDQESAQLEDEIENAKEILEDLENALEEAKAQREDNSSVTAEQVAEVDQHVIEELRATIKIRNDERMKNLKSSKAKLGECLKIIEDMERRFELTINQKRQQQTQMDQQYEDYKMNMQIEREEQRKEEQERLRQAQRRARKLNNLVSKLEREHQNSLRESVAQWESVRAGKSFIPMSFSNQDISTRLLELREAHNKLRVALKKKEKILMIARSDNDTLKSDIGKIKHKLKYHSAECM